MFLSRHSCCLLSRDELLSLKNGRSLTVHDVTTSNGITYKVKVTNTGGMAGGVSVLAMMTSTVSAQNAHRHSES